MDLLLPPHLLGQRAGAVSHMCPDCGLSVRPFCPVCLGAGTVSTERLARHQAEENRAIRSKPAR